MQVQLQSSVWADPLLHSALTDMRICSEAFLVTSAGWLAKSNVQSLELINCLYRRKLRLKREVSGGSHFDTKCSLIIVGWFFFFFQCQFKTILLSSASRQNERFAVWLWKVFNGSVENQPFESGSAIIPLPQVFSAPLSLGSFLIFCSANSTLYLSLTSQKQQSKKDH